MSALLSRLRALHPVETVIHLDFEAYYAADFSLSKLTTEGYVRDPRFEAIGVGVQVGKGEPFWLEEWDFRQWAKRVDWSRCAVNAHHTQLDAFILSERYDVHPALLCCTLSMARALHNGPLDLGTLGPMYGLGEKGNALADVKGKRRSDMTQAEWRAFGEYCKQDVRITAGLFYAMSKKLPKAELWVIDTTIRMFTEPVFEADMPVLQEALVEEQTKKAAMLDSVAKWAGAKVPAPSPRSKKPPPTLHEIAKKVLGSSDKFAALLVSMGEDPPTKFNPKGETIYAFAKDDPGMQSLLESDREEIRLLAEARLSVKSNIDETRVTRLIGIAMRGLVPFYLKAYGAHTNRWSGGDKMNPQNFRRGGKLRAAILAMLGWLLVVVDSGQIEARVAAWFARELGLLDTFRRNDEKTVRWEAEVARLVAQGVPEKEAQKRAGSAGDFYSDIGSQFFMKPISKAETPIERQLAKNMILGLGFNMGWLTFALNLLKGMLGSDPVRFTLADAARFGVDVAAFEARKRGEETNAAAVQGAIANGVRLSYADLLVHCAVADHFVRRYRDSNKRIAQCWRSCEQVIEVMGRDISEGEDPDNVRMEFNCLKVLHRALVLPSGLTLRYPQLRKTSGGWVYMNETEHKRVKLYGGKLFENIVQALARDIVAEQMLRIRADGHRIGTCTHDEVVAVVDETRGAEVLDQALAHFRHAPDWCADLPLNAEGGTGRSYGAC